MKLAVHPILVTGFMTALWSMSFTEVAAQIDVTYPISRMVVQRDNNNTAVVQVAGSYAQPLDAVEAHVVARATGQGTTTNWTTLQANPANGQFNGTISVTGGWYRLEVRGIQNGQVVALDSVDRFGVGEVFAIMGHSDAQGSSCILNGVDHCPTIDGASDDRVTVVALDQSSPEFQTYLNTADTRYLPGLAFAQLATFNGISPFAKMAWFWGHMGDVLVQRINVPVLLYNAGFGGTNMQQNYWAAYDIPFQHGFVRYDLRMPFANVRNLMNLYVPTTGLRAILLNHGVNDKAESTSDIVSYHYAVIDKLRQEFNMPNLGWIVAIASYFGAVNENVRQAQFQVINRAGYNTYQGPDLDNINSLDDMPDGGHYSPSGQVKAGEAWANALTNSIVQSCAPYPAQAQPLSTIACATGNQLLLTQPTGYEYTWNTASTAQSLTVGAGTYSARLRDPQKKVVFPPAITVPAVVRPDVPTVTADGSGALSICRISGLTLSSSYTGPNRWSTGATSQSITVTTPGSYTLQAQHPVYGCLSDMVTKTISLAGADLSLSLRTSRRLAAVGDTVTFTITVRNESSCDAGAVSLQNRLPANLSFVSSPDNLSAASGIVGGTLPSVPAGATISRRYVARLMTAGLYINAAEISASVNADPDSQPGSGTGDGQDDESLVDVRTSSGSSSSVFTSPNPNQVALPTVLLNQPAPDPAKADLSLTVQSDLSSIRQGQSVTITLRIRNQGGLTATNIGLRNDLPAGMQFVSSASGLSASGQLVNGTISQVAPGSEVSLSFVASISQQGNFVNAAQISAADQSDPDSTPGNGTTNGEDDTSRVLLRVR